MLSNEHDSWDYFHISKLNDNKKPPRDGGFLLDKFYNYDTVCVFFKQLNKRKMKKSIVLAIMIALVVVKSFAMTNTEIANILDKSKEANITNGIYNLDSIYPNQRFTVMFEDGITATVTVRKGDTGWGITEDIVSLSNVHGPIIDYPVGGNIHPDIRPTQLPVESSSISGKSSKMHDINSWIDLFAFVLLFCFAIIIIIIYFLFRNKEKYLKDKASNQDKIIKLLQEKEELSNEIKKTEIENNHELDLEIIGLMADKQLYDHVEQVIKILQEKKGGEVKLKVSETCEFKLKIKKS